MVGDEVTEVRWACGCGCGCCGLLEDAFPRVATRSRTKGRRHAKADTPVPSLGVSVRSMPEVYLRPPLPFLRADFVLSPFAMDRSLLLLFTPHNNAYSR